MPEPSSLRVAIIGGSGHLGLGLARRLHGAGVDVMVGSRDAARAQAAAQSIGLSSDAGRLNVDAARWATVIVVTVPYEAHRQTLESIAPVVSDKIVVDTTVRLSRSGERPTPAHGSAAEEARELLPTAHVVAGFHTVSAAMLADPAQRLHGHVLLCGDDPSGKERVAEMIRLLGMRAVDTGKLGQAGILESLAGLLLAINRRYKRRDLGIEIAGLD
ncbi:MAG TPA: NADPH-dependent F420 reductase [bacterium]|jgi:NADPH-dependent F420 reductase|nr:NADPH-dependent F420 reductase [bacterium]